MLNFVLGAIVMYFLLFLIGRNLKKKVSKLGLDASIKHMPNGHLLITNELTVEAAFYCLLDVIQQDKAQGKLQFSEILDSRNV